jgi:Flp pilus assembly protein TadG
MKQKNILGRDERGAAAVEFALSVPVLVCMIYSIFEFCQLYEANAGIQHALGEGARLATLYDSTTTDHVPTDAAIVARMNARLFGPIGGTFTVADPVTAAAPNHFKTLTVSYQRPMNFLLFMGPTITLTRSKVVYTTINT